MYKRIQPNMNNADPFASSSQRKNSAFGHSPAMESETPFNSSQSHSRNSKGNSHNGNGNLHNGRGNPQNRNGNSHNGRGNPQHWRGNSQNKHENNQNMSGNSQNKRENQQGGWDRKQNNWENSQSGRGANFGGTHYDGQNHSHQQSRAENDPFGAKKKQNPLFGFIPPSLFNPETKKIFGFLTGEDLLLIALIFILLSEDELDDPIILYALIYLLISEWIDFSALEGFLPF